MKKYGAFISYSSADIEIAEAIEKVFIKFLTRVFFAKTAMQRTRGDDWRDFIIRGVPECSAFLPLFSRQTINQPWVSFEAGIAAAGGLPRFPCRTESVPINKIPNIHTDKQVRSLFDFDDLIWLISTILSIHRDGSSDGKKGLFAHNEESSLEIRGQIKEQYETDPELRDAIDRIIFLARDRWVFIAGNMVSDDNNVKMMGANNPDLFREREVEKVDEKVLMYTVDLSERLFRSGFRIMSCPQVPSVGVGPARAYLTIKGDRSSGLRNAVAYRIGGLFPIDRAVRKLLGTSGDALDQIGDEELRRELNADWQEHLMNFRKSYLKEVQWLIAIGGSVGTKEECSAARGIGVRVCPLPFFGGTGLEEWERLPISQRPFKNWVQGSDPVSPEEVVLYLSSIY